MNHDITQVLMGAFIRRASALGYEVKEAQEETDKDVCMTAYHGHREVCKFEKDGGMRFYPANLLVKERKELHRLLLSMKEAHDLYENAKPLEGVGVRDFRLISEFGGSLLAAKMNEQGEVQFNTWDYTYDRQGVTVGHYYETNYEGAKRDFAARSGLVPENLMFTKEELAVLYAACVFQGKNDETLSYQEERRVWDVMEKVADSLPEEMKGCEAERTGEQEDSHGIQPD